MNATQNHAMILKTVIAATSLITASTAARAQDRLPQRVHLTFDDLNADPNNREEATDQYVHLGLVMSGGAVASEGPSTISFEHSFPNVITNGTNSQTLFSFVDPRDGVTPLPVTYARFMLSASIDGHTWWVDFMDVNYNVIQHIRSTGILELELPEPQIAHIAVRHSGWPSSCYIDDLVYEFAPRECQTERNWTVTEVHNGSGFDPEELRLLDVESGVIAGKVGNRAFLYDSFTKRGAVHDVFSVANAVTENGVGAGHMLIGSDIDPAVFLVLGNRLDFWARGDYRKNEIINEVGVNDSHIMTAAGTEWDPHGDDRAMFWGFYSEHDSRLRGRPVRLSEDVGQATAINQSRERPVVAGYLRGKATKWTLEYNGDRWDPEFTITEELELESLSEGQARPNDMNADGTIVGQAQDADGYWRPVVWSETGAIRDLGTLGGSSGVAEAINAKGQIVGWAEDADGQARAFIYDAVNGMRDLNQFAPINSNWFLKHATGIDDTGLIVGDGARGNSRRQFVMIADTDRDRIPDSIDNAPCRSNFYQQDDDRDGVGDVIDNCIFRYNPNQADSDGDGQGDACDQ